MNRQYNRQSMIITLPSKATRLHSFMNRQYNIDKDKSPDWPATLKKFQQPIANDIQTNLKAIDNANIYR